MKRSWICLSLGLFSVTLLSAGCADQAGKAGKAGKAGGKTTLAASPEALHGKPAPDFKPAFAINGKPVALADLKGKVVMLDFWATWCGPCIGTFPHLKELHKQFKDKGLVIVGLTSYFDKNLSAEKEQEKLKEFAAERKLDHLLVMVPQPEWGRLLEVYGNNEGIIPYVVLIDRQGTVRMTQIGAGPAPARDLEEMIAKLVAEK